jgi:hypothetical protein
MDYTVFASTNPISKDQNVDEDLNIILVFRDWICACKDSVVHRHSRRSIYQFSCRTMILVANRWPGKEDQNSSSDGKWHGAVNNRKVVDAF